MTSSVMSSQIINSEFWKGRRVLLTGHTGFKGSWLALWLIEMGAQVTGVGLDPDTNPNLFDQLGLKSRLKGHHIIDIRTPGCLDELVNIVRPEVVLHLAAQPLVRRSYVEPLQTWSTNLMGSLNVLEALKPIDGSCCVIMVTTDKVYYNQEWDYGYRENDRLGGQDPYSASKAATEIAIASWRSSFCGDGSLQTPHLVVATARSGNVIGGGDWAQDRIVPDAMRALSNGLPIQVRNPIATRPWQHVLEPLCGYLRLSQCLVESTGGSVPNPFATSYNFGPQLESNVCVRDLVDEIVKVWPGRWDDVSDPSSLHEAGRLHLHIDKAHHQLGWSPRWPFSTTIKRTVNWYYKVINSTGDAEDCCLSDISAYLDIPHDN